MLFVDRPITVEHVRAFCDNFTEGLRVEYKATFDGNVRDKIAKVISSFANSQGGVLVIGVSALNGVPQPPVEGFVQPLREELRLTVENSCLRNIYPPLLPTTTVVASDVPERVFLVIEVEESSQAPHAIENSQKVYVRTGDATNPYDLARVDLILDLVKRRTDPLQLRDRLLAEARGRAKDDGNLGLPRMEISVCPAFPRTALCTPADAITYLQQIQFIQRPTMTFLLPHNSLRRVPDGSASVSLHGDTGTRRYVELNKYGLLYVSRPFGKRPWAHAQDAVLQLAFADLLHTLMQTTTCATRFYADKFRGDMLLDVSLQSVQNQIMRFREVIPPFFDLGNGDDYRCHSDSVLASRTVSTEDLNQRQSETVTDILGELTWAFWQGNGDHPVEALRAFVVRELGQRV
jgi:schlafen family protein